MRTNRFNFLLMGAALMATADSVAGAATAAGAVTGSEGTAVPIPAKPEKPPRIEQNGIARPGADTQIGKLWDLLDTESGKLGRPILRAEARKIVETVMSDLNPATFATQYARWVTFHGANEQTKKIRRDLIAAERDTRKAAAEQKKADAKAEREKAAADKKAEKAAADKAAADAKAAAEAAKPVKAPKAAKAEAAAKAA